MEKQVSEGSLHKWFKGSKSKDGKGGWVNVVTGGTCASDEPGEGTPKCVSSAKRASMTKAERLSAARRKKKADPGQQQKSGAAKPTYVSTDKPKKKKMKETYERSLTPLTEKAKKCWPGYEKKGTKKMFGKTYNNCVKKEEVEIVDEAKVDQGKDDASKVNTRNQRAFGNRRGSKGGGHTGDDMEARRYNTKKGRGVKMRGKKDKTPINYKKRDSDKAIDELLGRTKKKEPTYLQKKGRQVDIKRKIKNKEGIFAEDMKEDFYRKKYDVKDGGYKKTNKMTKSNKRAGDSKAQNREVHLDLRKYKLKKLKTEGSLHSWFKGSKSKDGKPGWVNVVTGGTCASDKKGEGTPKCVSSSKRASMTKAERLSASRRKKKADPGQQSKSGAAKPTYVATDSKKKK